MCAALAINVCIEKFVSNSFELNMSFVSSMNSTTPSVLRDYSEKCLPLEVLAGAQFTCLIHRYYPGTQSPVINARSIEEPLGSQGHSLKASIVLEIM